MPLAWCPCLSSSKHHAVCIEKVTLALIRLYDVYARLGKTKYYQTHFMTPDIRLCDCPGLIFPAVVPRSLQLLAGLYPLHQLREPYTGIEFLAERMDLVAMFKLTPAKDSLNQLADVEAFQWSAYTICEVRVPHELRPLSLIVHTRTA